MAKLVRQGGVDDHDLEINIPHAAAGFAAAGHNGGAQVTQLRYMLCQVFICVVPRRGNQS